MDRLSSPLEELRSSYEVLVVGSGYGGSIAACRLARAGGDVALLERGRELHPGQYPRALASCARQLQISAPRWRLGDTRNLFAVQTDDDVSVLSGCGLGGTSLINSGVTLRPDPRLFDDPRWPRALQEDRDGMARAFRRAEEMLAPAT
jgi:cholesterol oxidase